MAENLMATSPKVTVLMPVFNGEKHLREAIDSILLQTFTDFELLIINDGSSDSSESIIRSYSDSRIRLINNSSNMSLIYTLNTGISLATGEYIARMDSDDICHPLRFAKQVEFLDNNHDYAMVAAKVRLIDSSSRETGVWLDDCRITLRSEILNQLPNANCIAHPTVMIRTDVIRKFEYDPEQLHSEDYDLWLRMASAGCVIGKIDDFLLYYRIHDESVTVMSNAQNSHIKNIRTKVKFILRKIKCLQINAFVTKVAVRLFLDVCLMPIKKVKTFLFNVAVKIGLR